ncbi:Transcription repressor OFP11 [Hibiscus syriacus]|uniref:Transcription repressor n=1 Tax=Hibiscus syriacus TaxID=106335 RepID=A0A6A2X8F1_HIBSY|nr:Transcription repressor OFP11 [Hibiscus syriacus]
MSNMLSKIFPLCFTNLESMDEPMEAFKNFNPLCQHSSSSSPSTSKSLLTPSTRTATTTDYSESEPHFASVFASQCFFFSSPGRSNSIIESPDTRPKPETKTPLQAVDGGVALKKYSPDPYGDFGVSMKEMIEASNLTDVNKDWEFLHELLRCYLTLNPENTHSSSLVFFLILSFAYCHHHPNPIHRKTSAGDIWRLFFVLDSSCCLETL